MTLDGMPLIYYGDELFMDGGEDPDCRRAMTWQDVNSPFACRMRELAAFRGNSAVLQRGSIRLLRTQGSLLAFERAYGAERLLCAINPGQTQQLTFSEETTLEPLLGDCGIKQNGLKMPEKSWTICRLLGGAHGAI
jgi:glycosidase